MLPCTEKLTAIDLRTQVFDVVPQEVNDLLFLQKNNFRQHCIDFGEGCSGCNLGNDLAITDILVLWDRVPR